MTDTPEDIRKTAAEVVEAMRVECHKERLFLGTVNACEVIRDFVAQALMEERERCLSILVATREFLEAEENPDYAEKAIMGCLRDLEREIRSPDKT